jgi:ABC-type transporter Mla subunit MlaD
VKHRAPRRTVGDYWLGVATGVTALVVLVMALWVLTGTGPK